MSSFDRMKPLVGGCVLCVLVLLFHSPERAEAACQGWDLHSRLLIMADLDRNGRADVVVFGPGGVWTSLAATSGELSVPGQAIANYGSDQGWREEEHVRALADIDGDGDADIVGFGTERVWTSRSLANGRFTGPDKGVDNYASKQGWTAEKHVRLLGDVDGDGKADIVGFGTERVWISRSLGDGRFTIPYPGVDNYASEQGWTPDQHVRLLADIDGRYGVDIVGFGNEGVWTSLSDENARFKAPVLVVDEYGREHGWTPERHVRMMADVSGDGLPDIVGFGQTGVFVSLSMGNGHFINPVRSAGYSWDRSWEVDRDVRTLADINGDGMADIVGFGREGTWTSLAIGGGLFKLPDRAFYRFGAEDGWTRANSVRTLADINGDGKADILAFNADGLWTALAKGDGGFEDPRSACGGPFLFNLVWPSDDTGRDLNGFPLNPRWSWQQQHPGADPPSAGLCHYFSRAVITRYPDGTTVTRKVPDFTDCTNQSGHDLVDEGQGGNGFLCEYQASRGFHGHLNWFPVTFEGTLSWGDKNPDDDYYMPLTTVGAPGVISEPGEPPRREQHTEFDTDETIDNFDTPWWNRFHKAVDDADGDKAQVRQFLRQDVGGDPWAIVTGLFGVDLEHDAGKSELHPVYALAARVATDASTEVWAMFVRNWGNEGFCSHKNWAVDDLTTYKFHLQWREGAQSVKVLWGLGRTVFDGTEGTGGPDVEYTPGQGIDVTFTLPPPGQKPLINGELHLEWAGGTLRPPPLAATRRDEDDERELLRQAVNRLTPAQRQQVKSAVVPVPPSVGPLRRLAAGRPARLVPSLAAPRATAPRLGTPDTASRKLARDEARLRALCRVTNGSPFGLPDNFCRSFQDPGPGPCAREQALVASAQADLKARLDEKTNLQAELAREQSPAVKKRIIALIAKLNTTAIPAARQALAAAEAALSTCH